MPPAALKSNLATTLRVFVFYICSCMTASSRAALVLGGISCHRRHSIGAWRYSMPPTALKSNLATTLRVLLFYICLRLTASSRAAYIKKQPYGFRKVVFSFGAVWHNLYEPMLEETAVLSVVSISFSVFCFCDVFFRQFQVFGAICKVVSNHYLIVIKYYFPNKRIYN